MARYFNASIFIDGVHMGYMQTYDYSVTAGGEDVYNDTGYDGATEGHVGSKLSCDGMIPVGGDTLQIEKKVLSKTTVTVTISPINGCMHIVDMIFKEFTHKGNSANRTDTVTLNATGGAPQIVG